MRCIAWLLLLLLAVGWMASQAPSSGNTLGRPDDAGWRRTDAGWQRAHWLTDVQPAPGPPLHPVVVGLLELMISVMALLALAEGPKKPVPQALGDGSEIACGASVPPAGVQPRRPHHKCQSHS